MDKNMYLFKIYQLIDDTDFRKSLLNECEKLLDSGMVDLEEFSDKEFALPKIILYVALTNIANEYMPLNQNNKLVAKNLMKV